MFYKYIYLIFDIFMNSKLSLRNCLVNIKKYVYNFKYVYTVYLCTIKITL